MGNVISDCRKKTQRDETFLVLKNGGRRPQAKGNHQAQEPGNDKEVDFLPKVSRRNTALLIC